MRFSFGLSFVGLIFLVYVRVIRVIVLLSLIALLFFNISIENPQFLKVAVLYFVQSIRFMISYSSFASISDLKLYVAWIFFIIFS